LARSLARDHDEKRAALLRKAAEFFADNGYDRASMSRLAEASGVSKALFYHYCPGKDALLRDILRSHLESLVETLEAVPAGGNPQRRLQALFRALVLAYRDHDAEHKLQLDALSSLPLEAQDELKALQRQLVKIVSQAIRDNSPKLFDRQPDLLRPVTMSAFGMLNWFFMWYREGGAMTREEYAALACDLVIGGLRRMAAREPA
jgi:AcrR family transcriptional regulator